MSFTLPRTAVVLCLTVGLAHAGDGHAHGDHDDGAHETRQLDAHVHGIGQLDIAVEGAEVVMLLTAPAFDIVGFGHAAESDEDKATMEAALAVLADPLALFAPTAAAGCAVEHAKVERVAASEDDHDHGHDDAHSHDAHSHDDHGHEEAGHDHDHDHGHDDHAEEAGGEHADFTAEYHLECANPAELTGFETVYFEAFERAKTLEVQIVTDSGSTAAELTADRPRLDLGGSI